MQALEGEAASGSHKSALKVAAVKQVREWAKANTRAVKALRRAEVTRPAHYSLLLQRSAMSVARAALIEHETLSIFLAPVPEGMRRWQKTFLVTTVVFAFLTVDVWCGPCHARPCRSAHLGGASVPRRCA